MKISIRFRTLTAVLLLLCVAFDLYYPPAKLSWADLAAAFSSSDVSIQFGHAHAGISVVCLLTATLLAIFHLISTVYRRKIALLTFLLCLLFLVCAFCFQFTVPALWLLPLWSSWRLSGGKLAFFR